MSNREQILEINSEQEDLARIGISDASDIATTVIANDDVAPAAPTLSASSADQAIDLVLTAPTTNNIVGSGPCVDFKKFRIYYKDATGITKANADGSFHTASTKHTFPTSSTTYFIAAAVDNAGNEGPACAEDSATPTTASGTVAVDDYTNNIAAIYVGKRMIGIEFQPPKTTWERWAGWSLYTANDGGSGAGSLPADPTTLIYTGSGGCFLHKGLNESYLYEYKLVVLGEDGTTTSGTISDNSGAGYQPNAADNSALLAETIMAERIFATTELYAQDAVIGASGSLRSGQTAYNTGIGWWMGDAAGTPKLSFGNPEGKWLTMDGTNFAWNFGNCSMDASGNLIATSVTVTGNITAGAGSTISADYITAGAMSAARITSGTMVADRISGGTIGACTISANNITAGAMSAARITAGTMSANRISGGTIGACTISANNITTGSMSAARITAGTMAADRISGGTIGACTISANNITTGTMSAVRITTGILTGIVIRTAASNARAELHVAAPSHSLVIYDSSGETRASMGFGGMAVRNTSGGITGYFKCEDNNYPQIYLGGIQANVSISQDSSTAALEPLTLVQADISEGLIDFAGSNRGVITGATNSLKSVRVELSGTVYRLALYVDA